MGIYIGAAMLGIPFIAWLYISGAWKAFLQGLVGALWVLAALIFVFNYL